MISIVIPVKNGGRDLLRCLDAIASQELEEPVEIVIVDSGSSDGSQEAARARGAVLHEIPAHEFTHGHSRNLGAELAGGELLVFISQDAYPADEQWLARLCAPLHGDPTVAGVYGRQLPHEGASPPECFFLDFLYGPDARRQSAAGVSELTMETTLFSNVNAALRRELWQRHPFVEDIVMSEDQDWARRVLLDGLALVYEPRAVVRHSHDYTLSAAFKRFFDSGASAERAYLAGEAASRRTLRGAAVRYARGELGWLWSTGQARWIPYAALYETVKMLGLLLGANHRRLPLALKRRMSAMPGFWA